MTAHNFATVNRRIEEERRTKYCGTASLRIAALRFQGQADASVTGSSSHNVDAIKRMFRQERGCRKEDSRHHVKALVSQQVLEAAVALASTPSGDLMANQLPYPELEFPSDIRIMCIEGHDRLAAADKVLQGSKKRWTVDLYLDSISEDLRLLLADGYEYQKTPDSGEYYVTIRQFQGCHGEENPFFENLWLARLATNANSRKLFEQLSKHRKFSAAFDALLDIPALFGGFRLGTIHQLLAMRCDEPNLTYLKLVYTCWWHHVCEGDKEVMRQITRNDIKALEGRAPGACSADHDFLLAQLQGGRIFGNFPATQRNELWSKVCSFSKQRLIPSLHTFFEDRKYLCDAKDCLKKILNVQRSESIAGALEEMFSDAKQTEGRCVIQGSERRFGSVAGTIDTRLDLGVRQLWLAAFRNYKELPADTQKKSLLALSRTKANDIALHDLASLASRLGFESDKLDEILKKSSDRQIAEHALFTARKPDQYVFHDQEGCLRKILDAFAAAVPTSANTTTDDIGEEIRQLDQIPQRYGRPNDADYEYDKAQLFLPLMKDGSSSEMGEMTSTFIRWSVYCAYFGTPSSLEGIYEGETPDADTEMADNVNIGGPQVDPQIDLTDNNGRPMTMGDENGILANTRQELELEQNKCRETSRQVQEGKLHLDQLAAEEKLQRERLEAINQQIQDQSAERERLQQESNLEQSSQKLQLEVLKRQIQEQNARLNELQQSIASEQQRLTQLEAMADQEQTGSNDMRQLITLEPQGPSEEPTELVSDGEQSQRNVAVAREVGPTRPTQKLLRHTDEGTEFDFEELLAQNLDQEPPEEQSELARVGEQNKRTAVIAKEHEPTSSTELPLRRTHRHTQFDFEQLLAHSPLRENEALAAAVARKVRIDFITAASEDSFVISDVVKVDPNNAKDLDKVQRLATSYMRRGHHLFDVQNNQLNPRDCFDKVVENGTYRIILKRLPSNEGRSAKRPKI